jgi:uncharacterized repeat protein (TIGR03803 family)
MIRMGIAPVTAIRGVGVGLAMMLAANAAQAGNHKVLYSFTGGDDGGTPFYSTLVKDRAGNLYGTTAFGGEHGAGTVFKLAPDGTESVLYHFTGGDDGAAPNAGLIVDRQGTFYGTTIGGGEDNAGTVFKLAPDGTQTVLYSFGSDTADGVQPVAALLMDRKGTLYGTTSAGGEHNAGTVFKLTDNGDYEVMHSFGPGGDGTQPLGDLIMDENKVLYGTTRTGGTHAAGAVFKITKRGKEKVIRSFGPGDGTLPYSGLVRDDEDNLYGTAVSGGAHGAGAVYKIAADGTYSVLYSFGPGDGAQPVAGLLLSGDGNLYGSNYSGGAHGAGAVFKMTRDGAHTLLYSFGPGDGAQPRGRLIEDRNNLYGTTEKEIGRAHV